LRIGLEVRLLTKTHDDEASLLLAVSVDHGCFPPGVR
jgi:hypothetical protein